MATERVRLRGYECIVCGKKLWATRRPEVCPRCKSNTIKKTKEFRYACDNKACKHNVEGIYCRLKEPEFQGDECKSFEPRKRARP